MQSPSQMTASERGLRTYVAAMFAFMSRGLVAVTKSDAYARDEAAGLPDGFVFEMKLLPAGPGLRIRKERGEFRVDRRTDGKPTLSIQVKHLRHAISILTFAESTKQAIANNRMVIDGDLGLAMRMNRVLARMQEILLPAPIATLANEVPPQFDSIRDSFLATAKLAGRLAAVSFA